MSRVSRFALLLSTCSALLFAGPNAANARGKTAKSERVNARRDVDLSSIKVGEKAQAPKGDGSGNVTLTLDPVLQKIAMRELTRSKAPSGAIVISDPRTGRILAWAAIGKEGDLVRRAKYPAASLFKIVTTTALLSGDHVKPSDTVCFLGGESRLEEDDVKPGCRSADHRIRFEKALGKSLNPVFGRLANKHLSQETLLASAKKFGFGHAPAVDVDADSFVIEIPEEGLGFARAAAGFGKSRMSPLGALDMMQTIANGGERLKLQVLGSPDSVTRQSLGRVLDQDDARALVRMLEVTTKTGTSKKAFEPKPGKPEVTVAGKTGTLLYEKPRRLVSWFAGFAPSQKPEIAVAVLLANDEKWWKKANEVAREVLDAHFESKQK